MGFSISMNIAHGFMMACSSIATAIGYINRKKIPSLRIFYFYPLSSLFQMIFTYIIINCEVGVKTQNRVIAGSESIFLIAEFFLIYNFFQNALKSELIKKLLYIIQVIYTLAVSLHWYIANSFFGPHDTLYILQAFCILIPVLFYFYELFKWPTINNLWGLASFWISTGIVIYFACTLPLFLMQSFIGKAIKVIHLYLINFIAYGIMFLLFIKAYLCPKSDSVK
jgi:hypothetical protein